MGWLPQSIGRDRLSAVPTAARIGGVTEAPEHTSVNLKSLLLCRDPLVLQTLRRLLDEMEVDVEVCSDLEFGM